MARRSSPREAACRSAPARMRWPTPGNTTALAPPSATATRSFASSRRRPSAASSCRSAEPSAAGSLSVRDLGRQEINCPALCSWPPPGTWMDAGQSATGERGRATQSSGLPFPRQIWSNRARLTHGRVSLFPTRASCTTATMSPRPPESDRPFQRESLVHNRDHVTVAIEDLDAFDAELADRIRKAPADYLPLFETAGSEVLASLRSKVAGETGEMEEPVTSDVQIFLSSKENCVSMRSIGADYMSKLVKIAGIAIPTSRVKAKATHVTLLCKNYRSVRTVPCRPGLGGAIVPRSCNHVPHNLARWTPGLQSLTRASM